MHGFSKGIIESDEVMDVKNQKRIILAVLSIAGMMVLILEPKTAFAGVAVGIDLCLKVVIPSLFPFLILSTVLTESTFGMELRILRPMCHLCRIPTNAAPLLLVGLTGGYPIGAQCITQAWQNGHLSTVDARRMLGFCNNAGPAFIFGMTASLFDMALVPWILWLIQITAVLITGILLPGGTNESPSCSKNRNLSPAAVLRQAITAMSSICGWVIAFRICICYCDKWILNALPQNSQAFASGILELTNGCCRLHLIPSDSLRFLLCTVFLSWGGLAVYMQTLSVTEELGTGNYLQGKLLQSIIAISLASAISPVLFSSEIPFYPVQILLPAALTVIIFVKKSQIKKNNSRNMVAQGV